MRSLGNATESEIDDFGRQITIGFLTEAELDVMYKITENSKFRFMGATLLAVASVRSVEDEDGGRKQLPPLATASDIDARIDILDREGVRAALTALDV